MKITVTSDLHGNFPTLPRGDLLIIAGDLTVSDKISQYESFVQWLNLQDYKKKIVICGNHDNILCKDGALLLKLAKDCEYLCDSGTEFDGLKVWGTPWSLRFYGINPKCCAFTGDEDLLKTKYDLIPDDVDILISHSPARGVLDQVQDYHLGKTKNCGSRELRQVIQKVRPKYFICGHIHERGGDTLLYKHEGKNTVCINASHVNEKYQPINDPITFEL